MNIIICGAGRVGFTIAKLLSEQNHSITIIDQSEDFNKEFYNVFKININLIRQEKPALWQARNNAIKNSNEEIIALLDDDSRIKPNWLSKHLACLDYYFLSSSSTNCY